MCYERECECKKKRSVMRLLKELGEMTLVLVVVEKNIKDVMEKINNSCNTSLT